jgi:sorting nexin-13
LGANIVKSDSKTFAVYSLSVTDVNNNSWSIKRRCYGFLSQISCFISC